MNAKNLAPRTQRRRGFTLVEVLIVVAIIAILSALAMPAFKTTIESGRKVKCLSNLKQLGQATLAYNADHEQFLPPFAVNFSAGGMTFWYLEIRPYLGASNTHGFVMEPGFPKGKNLPVFYCPSVSAKSAHPHTHYGANANLFANPSSRLPDESPQTKTLRVPAPSKMVMYTETIDPTNPSLESSWQLPANWAKNTPNQWFPHRHGETVNMVFCDAHAENVSRSEVVSHFTNYFGDRELWK